jgi:hypothetical protein
MYISNCGTFLKNWATDRFMTRFDTLNCWIFGYLFFTWPLDTACSLTISLPLGTTVRTVLLSTRDLHPNFGIGLIVSVGETLATSTRCYFTNYSRATTSSPTGLSAWLTCNNLVGSKLFIMNPTFGYVSLYEVMAFSQ